MDYNEMTNASYDVLYDFFYKKFKNNQSDYLCYSKKHDSYFKFMVISHLEEIIFLISFNRLKEEILFQKMQACFTGKKPKWVNHYNGPLRTVNGNVDYDSLDIQVFTLINRFL